MKTSTQILKPVLSPHLKSDQAFEWLLFRETAAVLLLFFAAIFFGGGTFIFSAVKILAVVAACDFLIRAAGFSTSPKWDSTLFNQALLLNLFLPANLSPSSLILGAFVLALFYRACGGRVGYVLQPVCLALAFLQCVGVKAQFCLGESAPLMAGIIFGLWFVIRFPRTQVEIQRMFAILFMAVLLSLLHGMALPQTLLWSAVAGEVIFDSALAPLTKKGRLWHWGLTLIVFALLLAQTEQNEAMIFSGLIAGFLAGWIEERSIIRKIYVSAKIR